MEGSSRHGVGRFSARRNMGVFGDDQRGEAALFDCPGQRDRVDGVVVDERRDSELHAVPYLRRVKCHLTRTNARRPDANPHAAGGLGCCQGNPAQTLRAERSPVPASERLCDVAAMTSGPAGAAVDVAIDFVSWTSHSLNSGSTIRRTLVRKSMHIIQSFRGSRMSGSKAMSSGWPPRKIAASSRTRLFAQSTLNRLKT